MLFIERILGGVSVLSSWPEDTMADFMNRRWDSWEKSPTWSRILWRFCTMCRVYYQKGSDSFVLFIRTPLFMISYQRNHPNFSLMARETGFAFSVIPNPTTEVGSYLYLYNFNFCDSTTDERSLTV